MTLLLRVVELAVQYCGSKELAHDWLYFPNPELDNVSPYTSIKYCGGIKKVIALLENQIGSANEKKTR